MVLALRCLETLSGHHSLMAEAAATTVGPVHDRFFDKDAIERTLKISTRFRGLTNHQVFQVLLSSIDSLTANDILSIWKAKNGNEYFVTFSTPRYVNLLNSNGGFRLAGEYYIFSAYDRQIVDLKIHWLHGTITNQYLVHFFFDYGKVLDVRRHTDYLDTCKIESGVRYVKLQLHTFDTDLPYIVKMGKKMSMLISTAGRLPICFHFNEIGHLRSECPNRRPPTKGDNPSGSYAQAVRSVRNQDHDDIDCSSTMRWNQQSLSLLRTTVRQKA